MDTLNIQQNVERSNSFNYSDKEELIRGIVIPNSQFGAKWEKDKGYAIGIENIKLTRNYETLEEALNTIGYGVDKDKDGEEILVKVGEIDYEMIARTIKALIIIEEINKEVKNG